MERNLQSRKKTQTALQPDTSKGNNGLSMEVCQIDTYIVNVLFYQL